MTSQSISLPIDPYLREPEYFRVYNKFGDTFGFYKVVSAIKTFCCDWPKELEKHNIISISPAWKEAIDTTQNSFLSPASRVTMITKITGTIQDLKDSKTTLDRMKNSSALIGDIGNLTRLLAAAKIIVLKAVALKTIGFVADGFHIVEDVLDLKRSWNLRNDSIANSDVNRLNATTRQLIDYQKIVDANENCTLAWIKIAKTVTSIAASALSFAALAVGFEIASPLILLTITTVSLVCSLWAHFYKETMTAKLRHPMLQSA